MKIDIFSIFPSFFDVLDLSLLGRAKQQGLLDVRAHNLRDFTSDKHQSVDDTPYGGGAGMVMKPEPWGEAIDSVLNRDSVLIVPTPAGQLFNQRLAQELSQQAHLIFACGRYEGIDERVTEHYRQLVPVRSISLGDYVLNGGEVAAMAIIEAVARLIPGMVGNPESLVEESHSERLLEYPSYTKPALWRELEVPPVLLSGDHGAVNQWRRAMQESRTRQVRPDLLDE